MQASRIEPGANRHGCLTQNRGMTGCRTQHTDLALLARQVAAVGSGVGVDCEVCELPIADRPEQGPGSLGRNALQPAAVICTKEGGKVADDVLHSLGLLGSGDVPVNSCACAVALLRKGSMREARIRKDVRLHVHGHVIFGQPGQILHDAL